MLQVSDYGDIKIIVLAMIYTKINITLYIFIIILALTYMKNRIQWSLIFFMGQVTRMAFDLKFTSYILTKYCRSKIN